MSRHVYLRILGYVATITLHVGNLYVMGQPKPKHIMADPYIRGYMEMRTRYFTRWTFFLQIFYAVCGLTCDVMVLKNSKKNYELPKYLKGFRDTLFAAIVWPSTLLVFTFFWTLYVIDRNLIFPPFLDQIVTPTSNHIMHTAIIPIALWEVLFQPRSVPKSHVKNVLHLVLYLGLYLSVLIYTYMDSRRWVYPIFQKIYGTVYFYIVMGFIVILCLGFYYLQWSITKKIWGPLEKEKVKRKTR
ncbi:androgen-dependent TFPI-regulating protein-like [Galleria mellonella]|uniref:Androgen-dependent TFPI-regulating protein-like n=1 Tax=Galleria mellonella TaxID=7137 RepID=A0ABM3MT33_GALME|nr:androgen-dependent TFPI-regulating protein-like [Galleria mellonella]